MPSGFSITRQVPPLTTSTRHSGPVTFVDFHLVVPGQMTVREAHDICDRIEAALKQAVDGALVTIHVEPEAKAKHSGVLVL